jgi:16S rRNA (cytosine1402-N4)-methyltransferase
VADVDPGHVPVLLAECLTLLDPKPGETVVDATAGRGGHAVEMARRLGGSERLILLDVDPGNLEFASRRVGAEFAPGPRAIRGSFARIEELLAPLEMPVDVLLADLGFSSTQMDDPARGFAFSTDGPLDMRLDPRSAVTAADLVASLPESELARIIDEYGEEPLARRIARKLVETRGNDPINSTARLARLVREAYGPRARSSRLHPATRTFMALRIAVNDELGALRSLLQAIERAAEHLARPEGGDSTWLRLGARVGIISFHSLEDRLVKRAFADMSRRGLVTPVTRKPAVPSEREAAENPRSRSAKLRVVAIGGPADPDRRFDQDFDDLPAGLSEELP